MRKFNLTKVGIIIILLVSLCGIVFADNNIVTTNTINNELIVDENIINNNNEIETIEDENVENAEQEIQETQEIQEIEEKIEPENMLNSVNYSERTIEDGVYKISTVLKNTTVIDVLTNDGIRVQLWNSWDAEQQNFEIKYTDDGYYKIISKLNGKVLAVESSNIQNGTAIIQRDEQGNDEEKWIIKDEGNKKFSIIPKCNNNFYIDVPSANTSDGTRIQLYEDNGTDSQRFQFNLMETEEILEDGTYRIAMFSNQNIGLDIDGCSRDNGANVLLWDWYETDNIQKKFNISYDKSDGYYTITNINSGKLLDVQNGGTENGTNVWQYEANNTDSQKWKIVKNNNGSYSVISKHSGLYLDILNGNLANGGNVQTYEGNYSIAQQFSLIKLDDQIEKPVETGLYEIASVIDRNKIFDITDGLMEDNVPIQLWDLDGLLQQKFKITYNNSYYTITAMNSNKVLAINDENKLIQKTEDGNINEKWIIKPYENDKYTFVSLANNYCIDIPSANASNGEK